MMKYKPLVVALTIVVPVIWMAQATAQTKKKGKRKKQSAREVVSEAVEQNISNAVSKLDKELIATPKQERKLLVFSLTAGYRHKSIPTGLKALAILGKQTGAYDVVLSDDLTNFEKPQIEQFDAICFLNTSRDVFQAAGDKKPELKKNLLRFIAEGKGFVGIHAATDTFHEWGEYGEMLGGYFDGHPWNHKTEVEIEVEEGTEASIFNKGIPGGKWKFNEEIYQHKEPYDSTKLNVLTRLNKEFAANTGTKKNRKDNDYAVSWYKPYGEEGKGRVFYCGLGHNNEVFWDTSVLSHYLAGIQYALGDIEVTSK